MLPFVADVKYNDSIVRKCVLDQLLEIRTAEGGFEWDNCLLISLISESEGL